MRPYQDDDVGDRAHIRHAEAIIFQPERESTVCRAEPSCSLLLLANHVRFIEGEREVQITFRESGTSSIGRYIYIKVEEI